MNHTQTKIGQYRGSKVDLAAYNVDILFAV